MNARQKRLKEEIDSIADARSDAEYASMMNGRTDISSGAGAEKLAMDVLRYRAYDDVRSIARDVLQSVLDDECDDVHDRIHEEVDNRCTYTKDCYMYAWMLDEADDIEEYTASAETSNPTTVITAMAFANLRAEVEQMVSRCLDNADWSTEDEIEEE